MTLLSVSDLPSGVLTPGQALERAEAMVAAALCPALRSLAQDTYMVSYTLQNDPRPYDVPLFTRRRLGPEVLRVWPITGLTSVVQDGVDVTAECWHDLFSIHRGTDCPRFSALTPVTVTFQAGWDEDTLPAAIQQAIFLTAEDLQARPAGIVQERLGDVMNKYAELRPGALLPDAAARLLAPWTYPGV